MPEPDGRPTFLRRVARALPWSVGVGIGVALGGWLTVAGGSGAPGAAALDVSQDVVVVPLLSALAALVVLIALGVLRDVVVRRRGAASP